MTTAIAGIVASLELQTAAFIANAKKAGDALDKSTIQMRRSIRAVEIAGKNLDRQFDKLTNAAVALGAALAVREFARFTRAALDSAGATLEMSQAAGISAERLQSLRFAAGQTGVGAETLDKAMLRLNKNIGDAANESTGPAAEAFSRLGVEILDSNGKIKSTETVFDDVAKRFKGIDDVATAASFAADLFGQKIGGKLQVLLRGTAGSMTDFEASANKLGLVLSTSLLQKANDASDTLSAMQEVFKTSFDVAIITKFSESIDGSASTMESLVEIGQKMGNVVAAAMQGVAAAAEFATEHMDLLLAAATVFAGLKLAGILIGIGEAVWALGVAIKALVATSVLADAAMTKTLVGGLLKLAFVVGTVAASYSELNKEAEKANGEVGPNHFSFKLNQPTSPPPQDIKTLINTADQIKEIEDTEKSRLKLISDIHDVLEKIEKTETETFAKSAEEIINREVALGGYIEGLETEARLAGESVEVREKLLALEEGRRVALRDLTEEEKKSIESAVTLGRQNEKIRKQMEESARFIPDAFERAFDRVGSAVTEAFVRGEDALISLRSVGRAVAADLVQSFAELALINPLKNSLFGGAAATLGSVSGAAAAGGGGASSLLGNFASSAAGKLITAPFGGVSALLFGKAGIGATAGYGPALPATSGLLGSGGTLFGSSALATAAPYIGAALAAITVGGKLFGNKSSVGPNAGGQLRFAGETFAVGPTGADNGGSTAQITGVLQTASEALNALTALPQFSIDPSKAQSGPLAQFIDTFGFAGINGSDDLIRAVISKGMISGLTEVEKTLLLGSSDIGAAIQKLTSAVESGTDASGLLEALKFSILEFTDPKGAAVQALAAQQDGVRAQLDAVGALNAEVLAQVEQLEELQLADVLKRFTNNVAGANDNFSRSRDQISGFLNQQIASTQSPLPLSESLATARGQFASLVNQAQSGGSASIASLTPGILDAAGRFNDLNRAVNASSVEFFNGFNAMTATLGELNLSLSQGADSAQVELLAQGAEQNIELRAIRAELSAMRAANAERQAELRRIADSPNLASFEYQIQGI